MHTETITWREVADELPDEDMTVLICNPDWPGDPVSLGWFDSEHGVWRELDAMPLDGANGFLPPLRWAELPSGQIPTAKGD